MRVLHPRPFHRPRRGPSTRTGFTLIELIIVVLVLLILMTLTVALVGDMLDSSRVGGTARQIQNYFAGARDRAIYAASRATGEGEIPPRVGVRFLSNQSLTITDSTTNQTTHRGFGSMVFIQETDPVRVRLRVYEVSSQWYASQLPPDTSTTDLFDTEFPAYDYDDTTDVGKSWLAAGALRDRGLIEGRREDPDGDGNFTAFYYLRATFGGDTKGKPYTIRFPAVDPYVQEDSDGNFWLAQGELSAEPPPGAAAPDGNTSMSTLWEFHLRPTPLPNEEPRLFPTGTLVEIQSSHVGGTSLAGSPFLNGDGSFDVMFNGQGIVDGPLSASGLVHLVVADLEDLEREFSITSPYLDSDGDLTNGVQPVDADGDGKPDVRQGELRIVSLRTRTGSAYASDVNPVVDEDTTPPEMYNHYVDPFYYAETGGEAN